MRWLILIAFIPCSAWAKDVNIRVEYVLRQERVKPDPKIVTPTIKQSYVLHEDGSLDEAFSTGGAHPISEKRASKMEIKNGAGQFTSFSTDLGKPALYRNSTVESTTCKIE